MTMRRLLRVNKRNTPRVCRALQKILIKGEPELSEKVMAPIGAITPENTFVDQPR